MQGLCTAASIAVSNGRRVRQPLLFCNRPLELCRRMALHNSPTWDILVLDQLRPCQGPSPHHRQLVLRQPQEFRYNRMPRGRKRMTTRMRTRGLPLLLRPQTHGLTRCLPLLLRLETQGLIRDLPLLFHLAIRGLIRCLPLLHHLHTQGPIKILAAKLLPRTPPLICSPVLSLLRSTVNPRA